MTNGDGTAVDRVRELLEHVNDALALDATVESEQALHRQADEAAEDAVRNGRPVALDAMSATERKVVHEHLKDREDVETYSEGTEPDRHLVVAPLD